MKEVIKSPFKFIDFYINESSIKRKNELEGYDNLQFEIKPSGLIDDGKKQFILNLEVIVTDDNNNFNVMVDAIGLFEFKNVEKKEHLDTYFYTNAPAIIYPYVRAYIASLTALSGYETINLPPVNIGNLMQELKDNTSEMPIIEE